MFLGIDCGTQGTKTLLVDETGTALGRGYAPHELIESAAGAREQHPLWWVDAMVASIRQALLGTGLSEYVSAVSVSGQQHGLVVLDANKEVIRPAKLWNDTETAPENARLIAQLGGPEEYFRCFGIVPRTGYTASKLLWMAGHEPENFKRIRHILLPHEYLNFWLTGELRAEYGDASGTGYFDVRTRQWAKKVLDAIDGGTGQLFAALPPLVAANGAVGNVRTHAAQLTGLPTACLVAAGGGDNMMGAIGTGNVREGIVTVSLGTSATAYSFSNTPAKDPTGNVAPFCSSSGGWLPLVCTMNATGVVTGTLELTAKGLEDIEEALESTPPGAEGMVFLPFLNGERTPDLPGARGSLHGLSAMNFTPLHLIRAAVEGVSFGLLNGLELITSGRRPEVIYAIGGGARSRGWRQLLADATGAAIQVPLEQESGCLGAVIQAMVAHSLISGQPKTFAEVAQKIVRHDEAAKCLARSALRPQYDSARQRYDALLQAYIGSTAESS